MEFFEIEETSSATEYTMAYMHSHTFWEMYFLTEGEKYFTTENKLYKLEEGSIVITMPFEMHKFEGGPFTRVLITLAPEYLAPSQEKFLTLISKKHVFIIDEKKRPLFNKLLKSLMEVGDSYNKNNDVKFQLYIGYLFFLIDKYTQSADNIAHTETEISPSFSPAVLKVIDYLNNHYNEKITLKELCDKHHMSKPSLCEYFKQATGTTIIQYKLNLQLERAKYLLHNTNKSLSKIANEVGFSSENYMGLIFRRNVGVSPRAYRLNVVKRR